MSSESSQQPDESTSPSQPARNPVERILVWGLILVLLGVVGVEAMARFSYGNSLKSLETALARDEQGDTLTIEEVAGHISGFPNRQDDPEQRVLTYTWNGMLKTYGSIIMRYSADNEVVGLETADAPPEEEDVEGDESDDPLAVDESDDESYGGEGGGGRRGGGRGLDPMQFDADGDGKISREEAPERMQEFFDEIDTNSDGFADEAELEARRAAFQRGGRGGGRGGEGGDRPQRPQRPDFGDSSEDSEAEERPDGDSASNADE